MNSEGTDSQNQSKRAESPARWQDVAVCWMIGIPTVIGIICSTIFLALLAWVIAEKIWQGGVYALFFLIVFSTAVPLVLWLCQLSSYAEIGKKTLEGKK